MNDWRKARLETLAVHAGHSVDPNTGGSNVLLYAVGAAVIGGTSLFGGKGRVLDAVMGGAGGRTATWRTSRPDSSTGGSR